MRFFCLACVFGILVAAASFLMKTPTMPLTPRAPLSYEAQLVSHHAVAAPIVPQLKSSPLNTSGAVQLTTVSN